MDKEDHSRIEKNIQELLNQLNPDQRACMILRAIEDMMYKEIARVLKIKLNTVRTRLIRARKILLKYKKTGMIFKMKCLDIQNLILSDFVDGEIKKDTLAEVLTHLSDCSDCKRFYDKIKRDLVSPFKNVSRINAPTVIWDELEKKLEIEGNGHQLLALSSFYCGIKKINSFSVRQVMAFSFILVFFVSFF